jgi:transmembrane 9 superfamily member 2/4
MLENSSCTTICTSTIPTGEEGSPDGRFINDRIREAYNLNWLIDGLPAARILEDPQTGEKFYSVGFELGTRMEIGIDGDPPLNNHYDIIVDYHVRGLRWWWD